jgi:hypothetical protein
LAKAPIDLLIAGQEDRDIGQHQCAIGGVDADDQNIEIANIVDEPGYFIVMDPKIRKMLAAHLKDIIRTQTRP